MKRTGIVLAVERDVTAETARRMVELLHETYPDIRFTVLAGGVDSVVFEFDDGGS